MAQMIVDGELYLSQSELRRLGVKSKTMRMLGDPDRTFANPHGYPGSMLGFAFERVARIVDVRRCSTCGYFHTSETPAHELPPPVVIDNVTTGTTSVLLPHLLALTYAGGA